MSDLITDEKVRRDGNVIYLKMDGAGEPEPILSKGIMLTLSYVIY